jgi:hypothetical protein
MREMPSNICRHPDGLLIRVKRREKIFQATVPNSYPGDARAEAIRIRDGFLAEAGPAVPCVQPVRSNTGIQGISETTMWSHSRPYPIFSVDWWVNGRHFKRGIQYGTNGVAREVALAKAKALRERMAGPLRFAEEVV